MKRRTFLQHSAILASALVLTPNFLIASETTPFGITNKNREFSITNTYQLPASEEITQLWIPIPLSSNYQKLLDIIYSGNYDEAKIVSNPYDAKVLYVSWEPNKTPRTIKVDFKVQTIQSSLDLHKATNNENYPIEVQEFLKPTLHIPVDNTIKSYVNNILQGETIPLQKAKKLYDWTVETMYRDNSVIGCGLGDAKRALEEKIFGGKCTDISSVYVALLRNANIPAREVFGIRAGKSNISGACGKADEKGFANITGGQHCRVELYISGLGWIPADPADVTKVRLAQKLTNNDPKFKETKKFMFGNWEMNWVAFNYARDFILSPKPAQYPLNMLGYPYAEIGSEPQNYYDAKSFQFKYTSQEKL